MRKVLQLSLVTLVLVVLVALPVSAQTPQSGGRVWLPLLANNAPVGPDKPFCVMWTDGHFLWINIFGAIPNNGLYVYNHIWPSSALVYHPGDEGVHLIGQASLAPAMAIMWREGGAFTVKCHVGEFFMPGQEVNTAQTDVGIFDRATVQVIKETQASTFYTIACIYHGDHNLTVTGQIVNADDQAVRQFVWHEDESSGLLPEVDCAGSPVVEVIQPEVLTSVNFRTENDNDTIFAADFFRFQTWLPIQIVSEPLQPKE